MLREAQIPQASLRPRCNRQLREILGDYFQRIQSTISRMPNRLYRHGAGFRGGAVRVYGLEERGTEVVQNILNTIHRVVVTLRW